MGILLLLLAGIHLICTFSLDEPIIMERIVHRVEWDELLLDYDATVAPVRNMTVEVNATLVAYKLSNISVKAVVEPRGGNHVVISRQVVPTFIEAIYDIVISWTDQRLRIPNGVKVAVPKTVKLWNPSIIVHNAISDVATLTTASYSDGLLKLHQRRVMQLAKRTNDSEVEPIFRAFEDGSADSVDLTVIIKGAVPMTEVESWTLHDQ